ncbi:MAG: VTT domain-containing protein [Desulfurococcaceae archaeon]
MLDLNILLYRYGLVGIFIVSLISNAIPYFTVPYLLVIALYSSLVKNVYLKILIVIFSALGASFGKIIVYLIGFGFRKIVSEESRKNLEFFSKHFVKSTFITIFIFASLPLPDDVVFIPIGVMKYDLRKYFLALLLGKLIVSSIAVYYSSLAILLVENLSYLPFYITIPILIIITLYISYLIMSINWFRLILTLKERGFFRFLYVLITEIIFKTCILFKKIIYR